MEKMKLNIQLFNGSVVIQTITETTDIDTNQSTFTIPAKMTTTGSTYNNSNASMTMQWKYESDSSWTSLNKQTFGIGKSSSKTKSWTLTLTHNNDGTLENVQFRVSWYITDSTNGTTGATTFEPTTIPRGSEFDTLNWNRDTQILLNSTISIPAIQHISPAYHKLEARFMINGNEQVVASWTGVSITNGYISFSFNSSQLSTIYNLMPSQTTHYIRMYLYTYSDSSYSTLIGEESVIWWTGLIPDNVVPVAHMSYSEGGDTPSSWGVYVKGKSKLNLILTGSGTAGSTITSYLISGNGYTYNSNTALTNYLSTSGNITFTGIVTDSRGRQGSYDITIYALDYYNPSISTAQVQRCDENGNIDRNGEYLYISYGASISSCGNRNKRNAHYKVGYRVQETGSYQYVDLASNVDSYSATGMLYTDGIYAADRGSGTKVQFSTSNTFDIQFYVDDTFNPNGQTNTQQLDTGFDLMNFNPSGKSMAIGKVSEASASEEKLEIGINTEIDGYIQQFNPDGRVGSNIIVRGNSTYPEASINFGNVNGNQAYIVGWGTAGVDGWNVWSQEAMSNVLTIDKTGKLTINVLNTVANTILDTRNENLTPQQYMARVGSGNYCVEFKLYNVIGIPKYYGQSFWVVKTICPWGDSSGGFPIQIAYQSTGAITLIMTRAGTSDTTWSDWTGVNFTKQITFNGQWLSAQNTYAGGFFMTIPFNNPYKITPTFNITSCQYYDENNGWTNCSINAWDIMESYIKLNFTGISSTKPNVLVVMGGSITL